MIVDWPAAGGCAVMAHRGGALVGPANSLEAIRRSIDLGAHAVEVDIHELADSSLVLFHDRHVPTAAGPVPVADLDLPDLTHLAGAVDTVGDLLDCAAGAQVGLYLDVKDVSGAALLRLIDAVAAAGLTNRAVVGSFDRAVVEHVVADGRLEASVLYHDPTSDPLELAATLGCRIVHPCFDFLPHMAYLVLHFFGYPEVVDVRGSWRNVSGAPQIVFDEMVIAGEGGVEGGAGGC